LDNRWIRWTEPEGGADHFRALIAFAAATAGHLQLKTLTVSVKAGRAVRRYAAVKCWGPEALVFQSVAKGAPMRDNSILVRARSKGVPLLLPR
jgi:hypothetical protein